MKKILAIILAAVLVLSFAACKKNDTNNDTTAGDAQTSGQAADVSASDDTASSEEASSEVETEVVTDKEGHTVIETKASQSSDTKNTTKGSTTPSKGLNTNNAAACIKAYQAAVNATKQFKSGRQNMALKGSITADGSLGALLKIAQKPVANALNKNSKDRTDIPGKPSGMQASHMKSASAVTSATTPQSPSTSRIRLRARRLITTAVPSAAQSVLSAMSITLSESSDSASTTRTARLS